MINRIKISIIGKNPDYFLKELIKKRINIYDIEKSDKNLKIIIEYGDYKELLKIKTTYKMKVIRRYGINKYLNNIKKYYMVIIMFILGIIINILLSHLILKIEVVHPNKNIRKLVIKDLNKLGLKKYK